MKKVLIALLVIAIIVVTAGVFFVGKLDELISQAIEEHGSEALGTAVTVGKVETDLKQGIATITDLKIANPKGFETASAIHISQFSANIDIKNQLVEEILINKPSINAELVGLENNFKKLIDGMPPSSEEEATPEQESDTQITIKSLKVLQAQVNLSAKETKLGERSFVMDDLIINDLTGTPSELSQVIALTLTKHVSTQISSHLKDQLKERAKEKVKEKAKEKIEEALEGKIGDKFKKLKLNLGN